MNAAQTKVIVSLHSEILITITERTQDEMYHLNACQYKTIQRILFAAKDVIYLI